MGNIVFRLFVSSTDYVIFTGYTFYKMSIKGAFKKFISSYLCVINFLIILFTFISMLILSWSASMDIQTAV